jgi:hypothetical protein
MMKSGNVQRRPDFFISPLKLAFNFPRKSIVFHWHPRQSGGTFGGTNPKSGGTSSMYPHPVGVQLHLTPLGPPRNSPTLRLESPASRLAGKDPSLAGLRNPLWRSQHRPSTKPDPCRGRTQPADASELPPERSVTEPTRATPSFPWSFAAAAIGIHSAQKASPSPLRGHRKHTTLHNTNQAPTATLGLRL